MSAIFIELSTRDESSLSLRSPTLIDCNGTFESSDIIRFKSCISDISKLKTAVGIFDFTATYSTRLKANAVLPIAGRAAISIRSERCKPAVL